MIIKLILIIFSLFFSIVFYGQGDTAMFLTKDSQYNAFSEKKINANLDTNMSECNYWITTEIDKMTGSSITSANKTIFVSDDDRQTGFGIMMLKSGTGGIIISIQAVGAGSCIDEGSLINILFTDGTRIELINEGEFNCKGDATVYLGGMFGDKKLLDIFKTKKIETLRVWTNDLYVQKDFSFKNQIEFLQVINCLCIKK